MIRGDSIPVHTSEEPEACRCRSPQHRIDGGGPVTQHRPIGYLPHRYRKHKRLSHLIASSHRRQKLKNERISSRFLRHSRNLFIRLKPAERTRSFDCCGCIFLDSDKLHKAPSLSLSCCIASMLIVLGSDETAWRWKSHGRALVPKISGRGGQYC
jgi:hypothetical protein